MRQFPEYMGFPPGVFFSRGAASRLGEQGGALGPRGLLLHSRSMRRSGAVERVLAEAPAGVEVATLEHEGGEPTLDQVEAVPGRYEELRGLWGEDPIRRVRDLLRDLGVENLFAGAELHHVREVVGETLESGSTAHNPKRVTEEDVRWFLERLFSR